MDTTLTGQDTQTDVVRVLHVDEEVDILDLAASFGTPDDARFIVETATTTSEGLARLAETPFDCIVSDHDMPGTNGLEFLETVREDYPDLPFILYTGNGSEAIASEAISAGVTDYFQKEAGTEQYERLAQRITKAVAQYRAEREATEAHRHMRELSEATNDVLWMFTHDWSELCFITSAYEEIWGRPVDRLEEHPQDFLEGIHPDDREQVLAAMEEGTRGEPVDVEFRVETPDGDERWVSAKGEPITDEAGNVVRVAGFTRDITDRKEREHAIVRASDRMERAVDITDAVVWEWEGETDTVVTHPSPNPLVSAEIDTLDDFLAQIHPDDRPAVRDAVETAIETNSSYDVEFRVRRDGDVRWIQDYGEVHGGVDGDPERLTGVAIDVTERKEREQALQQTTRQLDAIIEASPDPILALDRDGVIQVWNDAAEDVFGYTADEVVGEPIHALDLHDEAQASAFEERFERALAGETFTGLEVQRRTKAGDLLHLSFSTAPLRDATGTVTGLMTVARDITERKEREQELVAMRERIDFALESTNTILWEWDPDSDTAAAVHPSTASLFGREIESYASFATLIHPDDRSLVDETIESALESETTYSFECRIELDGDVRWLGTEGRVVRDEQDGARQVVGLSKDITDRKRRDQELERKNRRLEDFTSIVSHDLRNPLNVAQGRLDLAHEECDSEHLDIVAQAHDRMDVLIDDLLRLALAGARIDDIEAVALAEFTEQCWHTVETGTATLLTETDLTLLADRSRLQQLLENLIRNAVEHGGDDVTVTVGELDDGSGFYVEDDGPGIPEDQREQVFESGYSTSETGTGFGLGIVQEIVEAHDWTITLTDSDTGGARFSITGIDSGPAAG